VYVGPVRIRRFYGEPRPQDDCRVLVDRVWPRRLSRQRARLDEWCKQVAPSAQLRQWYRRDPARYEKFTRQYRSELTRTTRSAPLAHLRPLADAGTVTLLTAAKQCEISQWVPSGVLASPAGANFGPGQVAWGYCWPGWKSGTVRQAAPISPSSGHPAAKTAPRSGVQ
jgi:uncharacterized protein YeaO (DUF488 family)